MMIFQWVTAFALSALLTAGLMHFVVARTHRLQAVAPVLSSERRREKRGS